MGWLFSELGFAFPCWSAREEEELREFTLDVLTQSFNSCLKKKGAGGKKKKGGVSLSSPRNLTEKDKNRCSIVTCSGSFLRNILLASTRNHSEEKGKIYYFLLCKSWAQFTWRLQYCDVREFLQAAQCKEMEKRCQIVSSPSVFLDWIPDFTSTTSLSLALNPHPTTGVSGRAFHYCLHRFLLQNFIS